jgi:hypothetical protein
MAMYLIQYLESKFEGKKQVSEKRLTAAIGGFFTLHPAEEAFGLGKVSKS